MALTVVATVHPSASLREPVPWTKLMLRGIAKAGRALRMEPEPEPQIVPVKTVVEFNQETKGWTDFAYDLETERGLDAPRIRLVGVSNGQKAVIVDWIDSDYDVVEAIAGLFYRKDGCQYVQNGAFDIPLLIDAGVDINPRLQHDTMLAGSLLASGAPVSLPALAAEYLDVAAWKHLADSDPLRYNACDAAYTCRIGRIQRRLLAERGMESVFRDLLMPMLLRVVLQLNRTRIRIDPAVRDEMAEKLGSGAEEWRQKFEAHLASLGFEPVFGKKALSSVKVRRLLHEDLKLPEIAKKGKVSTGKDALARLESKDTTGTVTLLLARTRLRRNETHVLSVQAATGWVQPRWVFGGDEKKRELARGHAGDDHGVATGRLAARDFNIQNMPESARRMIVPSGPSWWLVEGDSNQIELRLVHYFSGDLELGRALASTDAHLYFAYLLDRETDLFGLWHRGWETLEADFRRRDSQVLAARNETKRMVYGWAYGMGAPKLTLIYGVPYARGKKALDGLRRVFPGVVAWWKRLVEEVASTAKGSIGCLTTPFGRRRDFHLREQTKMRAYKPQSTAADILYTGEKALVESLSENLGHLYFTVHDSNVVEGPDPAMLVPPVKQAMEMPIPQLGGLSIPCALKVGRNWGEMEKWNP